MKQLAFSLLFLCAFVPAVRADNPAIAFQVLKTENLEKLLPGETGPEKLDLLKASDLAIAQGYFEGECSLYLKTKDYQYRLKTETKGDGLVFKISMFCQESEKRVFSCRGGVSLAKEFRIPSLKPDWREEDYAVVFYRENLLK